MALLFLLNQKELELAAAEGKAVAGWGWWKHTATPLDGTLLIETRSKPKFLGLSHRVIKVLTSCAPGNVRTTLASIKWNRILGKKSFRVVLTKQVPAQYTEKELGTLIWKNLLHPHVSLDHPAIIVDIVVTSHQVYIGLRVFENTEDFQGRRAHLRPALHPSSLHPAIARAVVNLTCATRIHDPFCGSGGLLLEAGLAHKRVSGADIDPAMIMRAKKNCVRYGLYPELRVANALEWMPRAQALVADLPYGKSTTPVALQPMIEALLRTSPRRAVLGTPIPLRPPQGWKVRAHLTSYVHKSMTKHFYVMEKD